MSKVLQLSGFLGVDYSTNPLDINKHRASYMLNLDYRDGINQKRFGWQEQYQYEGAINGLFHIKSKNRLLVVSGMELFSKCLNASTIKDLKTYTVEGKVMFFPHNNKIYIVGKGDYLIYDIETDSLEEIIPTIPITSVQISAKEYSYLQAPNRLTRKRKNLFSGNVENTENNENEYELLLDAIPRIDKDIIVRIEKVLTNYQWNEITETVYNALLAEDKLGLVITLPDAETNLGKGCYWNTFDSSIDEYVFVFYSLDSSDYVTTVEVSEGFNYEDVMSALQTQRPQYYDDLDQLYYSNSIVRVHEVGLGHSFWKLEKGVYVTKYYQATQYSNITKKEIVIENGTTTVDSVDFKVNRTLKRIGISKGNYVFSTIPHTIEVEFEVDSNEYGFEFIKGCSIGSLMSVGNGNVLFLAGNAREPNKEVVSFINDFAYFPYDDAHEKTLGNSKITGFVRLADGYMAILKENSTTEPTVYYKEPSLRKDDNGIVLRVDWITKSGAIGVGGINQYTIQNLIGDNLFLSTHGVMALAIVQNIKINERYARERSNYINNELLKYDLSKAVAIVYKGKYILALNDTDGTVFVADSRMKSQTKEDLLDTFSYEWWVWNNIHATYFEIINDKLWFGREDGKLCKFQENSFEDITYTQIDEFTIALINNQADGVEGVFEIDTIDITNINELRINTDGYTFKHAYIVDSEEYENINNDTIFQVVDKNVDTGEFRLKLIGSYVDSIELSNDQEPNADTITVITNIQIVAERKAVVAKWLSKIFDLGSTYMAKTMTAFNVVPEPKVSGEFKFGFETRQIGELALIRTFKDFDFTNFDFTMFSFYAGFASSFRYRYKHRNFNYIMFKFESDSKENVAINNFSMFYDYSIKNRGLR